MSTDQTSAANNGAGASRATGASTEHARQVHRGREGQVWPWLYELVRLVARLLLPIVARLRVEGLEHVPRRGGAILAPNHISSADIPLVAYPVPRVVHFMAKAELFQVPLVGGFIRLEGAFPVARGESDREAQRVAERLLTEGHIVAIFPEGHRSEGRALIEAHAGVALIAMRAGVPVIPVAIWGSERAFHGLRYLWNRPTVTIRYGEPVMVRPEGARRTAADVKRGTDEIMGAIAALLPRRYRGVYAHLVPDATSQSATEAGEARPGDDATVQETPAQPS